jgi:hypothetical protein
VKSLLMWGVDSYFSNQAARALAADRHRLLLLGEDRPALEALDARLAQSELHRLATTPRPNEVGAWVQEQGVGLDGLVLFPPPPESHSTLFVPATINLRGSDKCVFGIVELVRELLPQLRRGKRPKQVLVVIDWSPTIQLTPLGTALLAFWQAALPAITRELNKEGSHFNVLCLHESTQPPNVVAAQAGSAGAGIAQPQKHLGAADTDTSKSLTEPEEAPLSDYVRSALALVSLHFSPTLQFLNGQFLRHPNPCLVDAQTWAAPQ